jgi:hypothetical protein
MTASSADTVSILHSKQFTFLIGKEESPMIVHSGAIAALSAPLERLVNGPMKESQENIARFPELETADFERICEFAYRGDYTEPSMTRFSDAEIDIKKDFWVASESIASREDESSHAWLIRQFIASSYGDYKLAFDYQKALLWYSGLTPLDRTANGWLSNVSDSDECPNNAQTWKDDVFKVLIGHARVYVFADKYFITSLRDLALHKLHKFLTGLRIFPLMRDSIMEVVGYAYDSVHTADRDMDEKLDPLRALLIDFITLHREAFSSFPGHLAALKERTEYAMDYVLVTERMLAALESHIEDESGIWG